MFPFKLQLFLIFFGTGFEVLKVVRIHMHFGLGHHRVWYMVMKVLVEDSGSIFTGHQW